MNYRKTVYWGTSSKIASTVATAGVMAINTDTKRVHVFDGKTKGGHPGALLSELQAAEKRIKVLEAASNLTVKAFGDSLERPADKPTYGLT